MKCLKRSIKRLRREANHSLIDCQLSGNRMAEAPEHTESLHLEGPARKDTLHAIAFILRRNRQTAPMGASTFRQERGMPQEPPTSPVSQGLATPVSPTSPGFGSTARSVNMNVPLEAARSPSPREGPATTSLPAPTPAEAQGGARQKGGPTGAAARARRGKAVGPRC